MHELDKNGKLSKNFSRHEFACKCCGVAIVDPELVHVLQSIRDHFGAPVKINSAYRCPSHNQEVGGKPNSAHLQGIAADIVIEGVDPFLVEDHCDITYFDKYGVGSYSTFTHIDVRKNKARWNG